jgi:hypothetical protein
MAVEFIGHGEDTVPDLRRLSSHPISASLVWLNLVRLCRLYEVDEVSVGKTTVWQDGRAGRLYHLETGKME